MEIPAGYFLVIMGIDRPGNKAAFKAAKYEKNEVTQQVLPSMGCGR